MAPPSQSTLLALINSAAVLADQPVPTSSTYIPKATWIEWANAAYQELYDKLIEAGLSPEEAQQLAVFLQRGMNPPSHKMLYPQTPSET